MTKKIEFIECNPVESELPFLKHYCICNLKNGFGIISRDYNQLIAVFDTMKEIALNTYILSKNNTSELILIKYSDNTLHVVEHIMEVIKVFKEYIAVRHIDGKCELYNLSDDNGKFRKSDLTSLIQYEAEKEYAMLQLPNDKFTIITKDFRVADLEFNTIKEGFSNKFLIVGFDNMYSHFAVIRLSDLEVSESYCNIHYYGNSDEFVKVYTFANPSRMMKIKDFTVSDEYLGIEYLSRNYALVKEDCYSQEKILRLKDFAISEWKKANE